MPAKHTIRVLFVLCLLVGSLLACNLIPNVSVNGTPVVSNTPGTQDAPELNRWLQGSPGVEVRAEDWKSPGNNEDIVSIVRIDLHKAHLQVAYQPAQPLLMSEWMKQTNALAIINGGYFDTHNRPTGLLISDGQTYGTSYSGFGGMLAVDGQGNVTLRSLSQQPYDPDNEQFQQATQSSPMLMLNGKRTQFNANAASSRRSVVAVDKQGRLLLIVSPNQAFSLDELADLLASSDLSIKTALNLDGGASTGLYVHAGSQQVTVDPLTPLPIVIVVK